MGTKPTFRWVLGQVQKDGKTTLDWVKAPLVYVKLEDTTYNERQSVRLQDRSKYNPKDCFKAGKR